MNSWKIEFASLVEPGPDEVDQFGFRVDDAIDLLRDQLCVDDEEARVETSWAPGGVMARARKSMPSRIG